MPIMVTLLYIGLSIAFHVWSLNVRWYDPMSYWWTDGLLALFVLQRFSKQNSTIDMIYKKRLWVLEANHS